MKRVTLSTFATVLFAFLLGVAPLHAQDAQQRARGPSPGEEASSAEKEAPLSEAFELRYVSGDAAADGVTDFRGATAVYDTEQRIEHLSRWADYGKRFFDDPNLDTRVFDPGRVATTVDRLKPQPTPRVRTRIALDDWKYLGYREGQREREKEHLAAWTGPQSARATDGAFVIGEEGGQVARSFSAQPWQLHAQWRAQPRGSQAARFRLSEAVEVGFGADGQIYYTTGGERRRVGAYEPGAFHRFKVEVDLSAGEGPTASTYTQKTLPAHALDGGMETAWAAANTHYPQHLTVDLGEKRSIRRVRLAFGRSDSTGAYDYRIEGSSNGNQWRALAGGERTSDSTATWNEARFPDGPKARYLRVRLTGGPSEERAALRALEVHGPDGQIDLARHNLDLGRYNLYVDGEKVADFVPLSQESAGGAWPGPVSAFEAEATGGLTLDDVRVTGFGEPLPKGLDRRHNYPFVSHTLIEEDFEVIPSPEGFAEPGYDDGAWQRVPYRRYAHGGKRNAGEALHLRKTVDVGSGFERAALQIETVRPAGTVYVNGQEVARVGREPSELDVTDLLKKNAENVIALRVEPHEVGAPIYQGPGSGTREGYHKGGEVGVSKHHMSSDTYSSWFAGLVNLELTEKTYVADVFARTTDLGDGEEGSATLRVQAKTHSEGRAGPFEGTLVAEVTPWYPEEADQPAATASTAIQINGSAQQKALDVSIPEPKLWTAENPQLYKVRVVLKDASGNPIDDQVVTTGLRTISQEGGTFRLNGEPAMLNGPLIFGHYSPLPRIAQWMFSPPKRKWVEQILAVKAANGTAFRMSIHDSRISGLNDPRLARIADQLGMMLIWQTPTWIREGETEKMNFVGLPKYVREVRNHPSIVMWQVSNHPWGDVTPAWTKRVLDTLTAVDPSRLVSPLADVQRIQWPEGKRGADYPWWSAPNFARGNMEVTLGYGKNWAVPRKYGTDADTTVRGVTNDERRRYLDSETNAWFDFESEETIGQPNWALYEGKPYYRMYSYEKYYDPGSIGRLLSFGEWEESQAWQAMSLYEAYRKKRWLDLDGTNWCPFRGGGNSGTYMKPLVDYHNHAKLGYHAMSMVYQPVLAGSHNLDVAYGPGDAVPVMVMNVGDAKTVDVQVVARVAGEDGKAGRAVAQKRYEGVQLPEGRTVTELEAWQPEGLEAGRYYGFEYTVTRQ